MNILHLGVTFPNIRKHLENAYDQNRLEEAVEIGNIMDELQCLMILNEQEEEAG